MNTYTDDWQWYVSHADSKGVLNVAAFKSNPYEFTERVGIKMDSDINLEAARIQTFNELMGNE